jgi:hypothetical protein
MESSLATSPGNSKPEKVLSEYSEMQAKSLPLVFAEENRIAGLRQELPED